MEIVIQIDERMIMKAAEQAVVDAFRLNDKYGSNGGFGTAEIARQAKEWAKAQDYKPMIAEVAPTFIKEAIYQGLCTAVTAAVKAELKRMKDEGEMTEIVKKSIADYWKT